jgi:hypothetical protein
MLAPNRYRQTAPDRAVLVRARDPQRAEDDGTVQQQTELIAGAVDNLELQLETLVHPSVEAFHEAVKAPTKLVHFVGHGFAGEGGEVLVLSETEQVPIAQVVTSGGLRAPIAFFSACEVGRGRQMSSGAQRGLASGFLDAGAQAILAPAYRIPSHFLGEIAAYFYQNCASLPVGQALQQTRKMLHSQQYHPACWATLALFGDPFACLTADAAAARPVRVGSWSSLVFRYVATEDAERQQGCLQALESDARLDAETKAASSEWLLNRALDPSQTDPLLERLRIQDAEAALTMEILRTLQEVRDVNTASPEDENTAARDRLKRALQAAGALEDSYAFVCVAEAFGKVGFPMNSLAAYRDLLTEEQIRLDMLSDDAPALERIATPLAKLRAKIGTMTFRNIGTRFGYADEDMRKADEGDPGALRRVALAMLEGEAHPETMLGVDPWYVWLLRWGGTGTTMGCRNVLGALRMDTKIGRIDEDAASAIRSLIGELQFASPLDRGVVHAALGAVEKGSIEYLALQLMVFKDSIEDGVSMSLSDVKAALELADHLNEQVGKTGIAAWLRIALARNYLNWGETDNAAAFAQDAARELAALQIDRGVFTTRLATAVNLGIEVAEATGDIAASSRLRQQYGDVLAMAGTPEQDKRDEYGNSAGDPDDFRTRSQSADS